MDFSDEIQSLEEKLATIEVRLERWTEDPIKNAERIAEYSEKRDRLAECIDTLLDL